MLPGRLLVAGTGLRSLPSSQAQGVSQPFQGSQRRFRLSLAAPNRIFITASQQESPSPASKVDDAVMNVLKNSHQICKGHMPSQIKCEEARHLCVYCGESSTLARECISGSVEDAHTGR